MCSFAVKLPVMFDSMSSSVPGQALRVLMALCCVPTPQCAIVLPWKSLQMWLFLLLGQTPFLNVLLLLPCSGPFCVIGHIKIREKHPLH